MKQIKLTAIIAAICCVGITTTSIAQRGKGNGPVAPVKVGSVTFNIGAGVGSEYKGDYYNTAFGVKGAFDWGLWQAGPGVVTLGIAAGGSFSNGGYIYDDYRSRTFVVEGRGAWHYGWKVRGLDTYAGAAAGVGFHNYRYVNNNKKDQVFPVFGGFVGASYFVTPRFGFNAEAGYDITAFQAGVIFKIK